MVKKHKSHPHHAKHHMHESERHHSAHHMHESERHHELHHTHPSEREHSSRDGHIGPHKMSRMSDDGYTHYAADNRPILEGEARGRVRLDGGYMGMLNEDRRAPANLPQEVITRYYPGVNSADRYYLDDTYNGIDEDIENSVERIERFPSKTMY